MAGKTKGRAPRFWSHRTVAPTTTPMLAMPRLPAPTATVSPRLIGNSTRPSAWPTARGMSATRGRGKVWRMRVMRGKGMGDLLDALLDTERPTSSQRVFPGWVFPAGLWYKRAISMLGFPSAIRYLVLSSLLVAASGCAWLRPAPTPILPADELSDLGDQALEKRQYAEAREHYTRVVERHPN